MNKNSISIIALVVSLLSLFISGCSKPTTVRHSTVTTKYQATDNYVVGAYHYTKGAVYPISFIDSSDGNYYIIGEGNFLEGGIKITPDGKLADTRLYVAMAEYGGWSRHPFADVINGSVGLLMFEPIER